MAYLPNSRPMPVLLGPPQGMCILNLKLQLAQTVPDSNWRMILKIAQIDLKLTKSARELDFCWAFLAFEMEFEGRRQSRALRP